MINSGFMKDCPTGKLSRNEFIRIYVEFFPHGNPRNFAEWVFNVFDESNKGKDYSSIVQQVKRPLF